MSDSGLTRSNIRLVSVSDGFGLCKKAGPVNHVVFVSWDAGTDLDAWSAGLSSVLT